MKAVAVAVAPMMGLFFVLTGPVQAGRWGDFTYCKSGAKVANTKLCKENGGKR
jgi:hypothetical protein